METVSSIPTTTGGGRDYLLLSKDSSDLNLERIQETVQSDRCGAISTFVGVTRDNFNGKKVVKLEYEAYEPMAITEMQHICDSIRKKWGFKSSSGEHSNDKEHGVVNNSVGVDHIAMVHRVGEVGVGGKSIVISLSSVHREEGLEALKYAIDTLKKTVPIWKREIYSDGSVWKGTAQCTHEHVVALPGESTLSENEEPASHEWSNGRDFEHKSPKDTEAVNLSPSVLTVNDIEKGTVKSYIGTGGKLCYIIRTLRKPTENERVETIGSYKEGLLKNLNEAKKKNGINNCNEQTKKAVKEFDKYVCDDDVLVFRYQPPMGKHARAIVHKLADSIGIYHISKGEGKKRTLVLAKPFCLGERGEWAPFDQLNIHRYISLTGPSVEMVARRRANFIPDDYKVKRIERDLTPNHHITLITSGELNHLATRLIQPLKKEDVVHLLKIFSVENNWVAKGVGCIRGEYLEAKKLGTKKGENGEDNENEVAVEKMEVSEDVTNSCFKEEENSRNVVYFEVIDWPAFNTFRTKYLTLPPFDYHITLGFKENDVHDVSKGIETLII